MGYDLVVIDILAVVVCNGLGLGIGEGYVL